MTHSDSPDHPLEARSSGPLTGKVRVPGDKSISHRALILGALSVGETRISGLLEGEDVLNTAKAMRALGARVERTGEFAWSVRGVGVGGFAQPQVPLDFGNSGTGCRLVMGAVAGCPITAIFDGDASLRSQADAAGARPPRIDGRAGRSRRRGRPAAADAQRRARPAADPLPHAGGVGADQIGGAAGGTGRARRHHGDRDRGEPRPHRTDAEAFRRADRLDPRRPPWPQDHADRATRTAWRRRRGPGRSVIGGVPDRGGPDCRRLRYRAVGCHDQPAAHRADDDAARNGRRRSRRAKGAAMPASRWRNFACAPRSFAGSRCRRSARPR